METALARADISEYEEVASQAPNPSTYANIPFLSTAKNIGGTGHREYESLEMQPSNHQYESLTRI